MAITETKKRCKFIKPDGAKCEAWAMRDSDYCYLHNPNVSDEEKKQLQEIVAKQVNTIKKQLRYTVKEAVKAYIPADMNKITEKVFKRQLRKGDYKGKEEIKDLGLVEKWESGDVEYFIKAVDLSKLKNQTPKVYVSQDKNIKLLLALVERKQFNKEEKKAEASFTLKEYAKFRGYTDEDIKTGGKFLTELKRDLLSGAYTTYRINKIKIDGKTYTAHGIPNFYTLLEPENPKSEWKVMFNPFYAGSILEVLKGEAKQYFTHYLKEVADRKTTEKPYLHFFYNQLVYRRQEGKATVPKKVVNLLREMGVAEKYLKRPQECFKILKDCLIYITTNYPEELESIKLYNDFNREKTKQLPLSSLKALEIWDYKNFKEAIKSLGVKDIREAFISFIRRKETKRLSAPEPQDSGELIDKILDWADRCIDWSKMTALTLAGTDKFLKDCLRHLGFERLNNLFRQEAQSYSPNAVRFLSKTLPNELKANKKVGSFKKDYGLNRYGNEEIKKFMDNL